MYSLLAGHCTFELQWAPSQYSFGVQTMKGLIPYAIAGVALASVALAQTPASYLEEAAAIEQAKAMVDTALQ